MENLDSSLRSPSCSLVGPHIPQHSTVPAEWLTIGIEELGPPVKRLPTPSHVLGSSNPTCSVEFPPFFPPYPMPLLNNPRCSLEYFNVPPEESSLDVKKGFHDLLEHAALLHFVLRGMEPHSDEYKGYGLKGSEEEVIFYAGHIGTPSSLASNPTGLVSGPPIIFIVLPVLFLALNGLPMRRSQPVLVLVMGHQ